MTQPLFCALTAVEKSALGGGRSAIGSGGGGEGGVVVGKKCGGPYTKLFHPYSSHANGKTTQ